jgi:hypothetical protein
MKLPTSTKPTSGFHICDILELNKDKQSTDENDNDERLVRDKSKSDENCDEEIDLKKENLSSESDELDVDEKSIIKRRHSPSPTTAPQSPTGSSQDSKDLRRMKKQKDESSSFESSGGAGHHLLNDTIHQYPHLFQNPAMRPWFNTSGKCHSNSSLIH